MSPGLVAIAVGIAMIVMWLLVWSSEGVRVVKARDLLAAGATFIDVDSPQQYKAGHPEGSQSVPLEELPRIAPDLGAHDHPIVVYAHSGWRAMFAAWRLRAIGFHEVVSVGTARP
jgi:phage shock protein E